MTPHDTLIRTILNFFSHNPDHRFKSREIARLLYMEEEHLYQEFRETLRELAADGRITENPPNKYSARTQTHKAEGVLDLNARGFGFISVEGRPDDIFIEKGHLGTAFDGDTVEIEIFGAAGHTGRPEGRILSVLKRKTNRFVGSYLLDGKISYVVPDGKSGRRDFVVVPDKKIKVRNHDKVVVELIHWTSEYVNPEAQIIRVLGQADAPGVDLEVVARSYDIPIEFPDDVLAEAERIRSGLTRDEIARRLDLRKVLTLTIDPEDAKDFDDAISLETLENGNLQLGVHIADVSWYVTENSAIDREALRRGTSVYMPGRCIPMLPPKLSEDLCSLRPNVDRPAVTILMELNQSAEVVHAEFHESVIHSDARLTYVQANELIESKTRSKIADKLRQMLELSRTLRTKRMHNGGLDFDLPEVMFTFDDKTGALLDIKSKVMLPTNSLVEECMLLANVTAVHLAHGMIKQRKKSPLPFIYRIHDRPKPEKLTEYYRLLKYLNIPCTPNPNPSPKLFQKIFKEVQGRPEQSLVEEITLRTMQKAIYDITNVGHFGLAFTEYTHFTSPIRRYPDMLVHRMLKAYREPVDAKRAQYLREKLPVWCDWTSKRERQAMEVEREAIKVKQLQFLKGQVGAEYKGIISGVMRFGLFIELEGILAEGLVHIRDLEGDYYRYDEARYALIGNSTGRVYRLADPVKVKIVRVDEEDRKLDMVIIQDESKKGTKEGKGRSRKRKR